MSCHNRKRQAEEQLTSLVFFDIIWDESNLIPILRVFFFHSGRVSFSGDIFQGESAKFFFHALFACTLGEGIVGEYPVGWFSDKIYVVLSKKTQEQIGGTTTGWQGVARVLHLAPPSFSVFCCSNVFYVPQSRLCSIFLKRTPPGDSPFSSLEYLGHWHVAVVSVLRPQYKCMANHLLCSLFSFFS